MSKPSKKRLEKKKEHQKKDYKKILRRRGRIRAQARSDRERAKLERESRIPLKPYTKNPKPHAKTPEEVAAQIEENYKALAALEEDYEREMANRDGLNKALEAEGFKTLREKMDFLNKEAQMDAQFRLDGQYSYVIHHENASKINEEAPQEEQKTLENSAEKP